MKNLALSDFPSIHLSREAERCLARMRKEGWHPTSSELGKRSAPNRSVLLELANAELIYRPLDSKSWHLTRLGYFYQGYNADKNNRDYWARTLPIISIIISLAALMVAIFK